MKDEELWHNDRSEQKQDRRDDRRDTVTPETGPLGFITDDRSTPPDKEEIEQSGVGKGISNDVETFTDKSYDQDRTPDETSTRRDDELEKSADETMPNYKRDENFGEKKDVDDELRIEPDHKDKK